MAKYHLKKTSDVYIDMPGEKRITDKKGKKSSNIHVVKIT